MQEQTHGILILRVDTKPDGLGLLGVQMAHELGFSKTSGGLSQTQRDVAFEKSGALFLSGLWQYIIVDDSAFSEFVFEQKSVGGRVHSVIISNFEFPAH